MLDAYLKEMAKAGGDAPPRPPRSPPSPRPPSRRVAAAGRGRRPGRAGAGRHRPTLKQKARWTLQAAREQIRLGHYDEAARMVAEVQAMDVRWGLFDDTPAR